MFRSLKWLGAAVLGMSLSGGAVLADDAPAAQATPPAVQDAAAPPAAKELVQRQLDAFAHDDAAGAYALATPGIQAMFTDSDTFLSMVRKTYAPVYRHRSAEFGVSAVDGDNAELLVTLVDLDNQVWKAVYKLSRLPNGDWRIAGCVLLKSADTSL